MDCQSTSFLRPSLVGGDEAPPTKEGRSHVSPHSWGEPQGGPQPCIAPPPGEPPQPAETGNPVSPSSENCSSTVEVANVDAELPFHLELAPVGPTKALAEAIRTCTPKG